MPRQFYLTADPAPDIPNLTWKGQWNKTSDAVTKRLDSTKTTVDLDMYTIQSVASSEATASHLYRVALARFVGGPLLAQFISGTMQVMAGVWATEGGSPTTEAELYYAAHVWVTVGDTDVVRGTLVDNFAELATSLNPWPPDPKGRDLILSAAVNALEIRDGDRLVVELGFIARNTSVTEYVGAMYYGTNYYSRGTHDMYRDL